MYEHLTANPQPSPDLLKFHRIQDLRSYWLHTEAVRRVKADPALLSQVMATQQRWAGLIDIRTEPLRRRWDAILATGDWDLVLARTDEAQQLRQASPLGTVLPADVRLAILEQVRMFRVACLAAT